MIPLIERAAAFADRVAIVDQHGSYTYRQLLDASAAVAAGVSLYLLLTREDRRSSETTQAAGDLELRAGTASVSLVGHF